MAWTKHGHQIDGTATLDLRTRPSEVVRCGGPGLCDACSKDASLLTRKNEEPVSAFQKYQEGNLYSGFSPIPLNQTPQDEANRYQNRARQIVFEYVTSRFDKSDPAQTFTANDIFVVWFSKTLKNWKALVSTTLSDGKYYELTHNGEKNETYLDVYVKIDNFCIPDASGDETVVVSSTEPAAKDDEVSPQYR